MLSYSAGGSFPLSFFFRLLSAVYLSSSNITLSKTIISAEILFAIVTFTGIHLDPLPLKLPTLPLHREWLSKFAQRFLVVPRDARKVIRGWVNQYVGSPVIPQRRDMAPISECPDTLWLLVGSHFANGKIKAETTGGNFNRKHPDEVDAHLNSFKLHSILN